MSGPSTRLGTDRAVLAVGSVASGVLAYTFVLIGARALGDEFSPITVLWSYWLVVTAVIAIPLQRWLVRSTKVGTDLASMRVSALWAAAACLAGTVVVTALSIALRGPLFDSQVLGFPLCIGGMTIGAFLVGSARGLQAAWGRYTWVSASLAGENGIRVAGAIGAVLLDADASAYAFMMPLGFAVALMPPSALLGPLPRPAKVVRDDLPRTTLWETAAVVVPLLIWAAPPVAAALLGAPEAGVTGLFLLVALAHLPNLAARTGWRPRILAPSGAATTTAGARPVVGARLLGVAALVSAVAAVSAFVSGPELVRLLFGDAHHASRPQAAFVAAGGVLAVTVLLATLDLVARQRPRSAVRAGVAATAGGTIVAATGIGQPATTAAAAFLAAFALYAAVITLAPPERR